MPVGLVFWLGFWEGIGELRTGMPALGFGFTSTLSLVSFRRHELIALESGTSGRATFGKMAGVTWG
jgi:hypothetical protein